MYKRKKFHGGYGLLFGVLCCLLLGFSFSTCYASTTNLTPVNELNIDILKAILTKYKDDNCFGLSLGTTYGNKYISAMNNVTDEQLQLFCDKWNSLDFESKGITALEQCIITVGNYNNNCLFDFFFTNNGIGNNLDFFTISTYNTGYQYFIYKYRNDIGNFTQGYFVEFQFVENGTFTNPWIGTVTSSGRQTSNGSYDMQISSNPNIITSHNFRSFRIASDIFYNNNWYKINSSQVIQYEPPAPPEPENTTGNITNNSGEKTGSIDLSGIENGITNLQNQISGDTQKIIDNQNQNTEQIVGAINNANENYWGNSGELNGEKQEEEIENNINEIMENISGELAQNEVMRQLERSRGRLFRLF